MGCGGSRLGGKPALFPTRLRPLFLLHARRSPSKLLLHERDEDSISQKYMTPLSEEENGFFGGEEKHGNPKLEIEAGFRKNQTGSREESEFEDALDAYEDEDEDEDRTRMIGHEDDGAFPGSPTFRYFCKDINIDDGDDLGKIYAISDDDDNVSSKENYNDEKKKVKSGRKRRSFKKVLAVKKLFNVKSCYHSSHDHHLLIGKTVA